jgi:Domain of unknown function (DUF3327)
MSELKAGKPIERAIARGERGSCYLLLDAQDLAKVRVETEDRASVIAVYSPDNICLRRYSGDGTAIRLVYFVADRSGRFRIEIQASESALSASFVVSLEQVTSLAERLAPPSLPEMENRLLKDLRHGLGEGNECALDDFWKAIEKIGTPLFESLAGDDEHVLSTFVWRGDCNTRSVLVSIPPYSRIAKEKFMMSRVAETDVWAVTVIMPARSRFLYSLVINSPRGLAAGPVQPTATRAPGRGGPLSGPCDLQTSPCETSAMDYKKG